MERDQNERLGELPDEAAEAIRVTWRRTWVKSLWPFERLFFECYARGAQGESPLNRLVPALVEQTLDAVSSRADVAVDEEGRAGARLGLAVIRGLLLDLVATGDRKATNRALELYTSMVADRSAGRHTPRRPKKTSRRYKSSRSWLQAAAAARRVVAIVDDFCVRVVPFVTNAIFGATTILVLECLVADVLRDGAQALGQQYEAVGGLRLRRYFEPVAEESKRPLCRCG